MRQFRDLDGRDWSVLVGRASWGAFLALFVPSAGGETRQAYLQAVSQLEAERELADLSDRELARLLESAGPREE